MTDLHERHDPDWLEQRARRASVDLAQAAACRAVSPLDERSGRTHPFARPALLGFVAATVVAGLLLLVGAPMIRPADETRRPEDLRFLVADLPDGWHVAAVKDEGVGTAPELTGREAIVYGLPGGLASAAMWLSWLPADAGDTVGEIPGPHDAGPEFLDLGVDGVDATCMAPVWGGYECLLTAPVGTMELDARHMTLEQIRLAVAGLRVAFGSVRIDERNLPVGMVELQRGRQGMDPSYLADERTYNRSSYTPVTATDNTASIELIVAWDEGLDSATLAMIGDWKPTTVQGHPAFVQRLDIGRGAQSVFWTDGSRRFYLSSRGVDVDLVRLAEAVRPATDAEWRAKAR